MKKKVSVVMCTYNGERFLREQLDSIVNQTYPIYELLIRDDLSTDATWDILEEFEAEYSFVKVLRNKKNLGIAENFKQVFYLATGDYIFVSDQDDIWFNNKIEYMLNAIGDNWLVTSASYPISEIYSESIFGILNSAVPNNFFLPLRYVALQATLSGHDMLFRKDLLSYIPESFWKCFWYDFSLTIVAIGLNKITYLDEYLTIWRRHITAATYSEKKDIWRVKMKELILVFFNRKERMYLGRFYSVLKPILLNNKKAYDFASYMEKGSLFRVCFYTLRYKADFVDKSVSMFRSSIRALLIPLLTYRNLKNWNSMYLNEATSCSNENL